MNLARTRRIPQSPYFKYHVLQTDPGSARSSSHNGRTHIAGGPTYSASDKPCAHLSPVHIGEGLHTQPVLADVYRDLDAIRQTGPNDSPDSNRDTLRTMPTRIRVPQRVVQHIRIPVQRLRVPRPRHERIRATKRPAACTC